MTAWTRLRHVGCIYVMRHGQTVHNRDQIIQGPRIDSELSDLGLHQADALGHVMAQLQVDALYSSPLLRARQTAKAVADHRDSNAAVLVAPEMYEMDYGDLSGCRYGDVQDEVAQVLDAWQLGFTDEPFPGGESAALAQHRIRPFALRLLDAAYDHNVAVVAHGRINRILLATLQHVGLDRLEEYPQANACINELAVQMDGVMLVRLNDTSHLDLAGDADSFS